MKAVRDEGRIAGFLYLLAVVGGMIELLYIPGVLFVRGNAAATAANLVAHESLYRFDMALDLVVSVIETFLVLALYWIFRDVDKRLAVMMLIFGTVPVIGADLIAAMLNSVALMVAHGADFLSAFDKPQRDALLMFLLRLDGQQTLAVEIFWGMWLFPLGLLVFRSRLVPRFLGVWLFLNGAAYVVESLGGFLWPQYLHTIGNAMLPVQFGEVAFMLWLLIKGVKRPGGDDADAPAVSRQFA